MRIKTAYLSRQFVILPTIGIVKGSGEYRCRVAATWGCWGISIGLGKPLQQAITAKQKEDS